jgi:hydroxymethylpyrimidine/phosphomethylpyrimidine kinase
MLASPAVVAAVGAALRGARWVVYDPVMVASSGDALAAAGFAAAVKSLFPGVDLITPNLAEAARLLDAAEARSESEMVGQGRALLALGARAVLMKGGHLAGSKAVDLLVSAEGVRRFAGPRIETRNLHGTGCVLSSAIAAHIALGRDLVEAVDRAKAFTRQAIANAQGLSLGKGPGPLMPGR